MWGLSLLLELDPFFDPVAESVAATVAILEQVTALLEESLRNGSDGGFDQHLSATYADVLQLLADLTAPKLGGFVTVIDGNETFVAATNLANQEGGQDLLDDLSAIAGQEEHGSESVRQVILRIQEFQGFLPTNYSLAEVDNITDWLRSNLDAAVANSTIETGNAITVGYSWGLTEQLVQISQLFSTTEQIRMGSTLVVTALAATQGDQEAEETLGEALAPSREHSMCTTEGRWRSVTPSTL